VHVMQQAEVQEGEFIGHVGHFGELQTGRGCLG
jgi:hypothetical protein